jgi:hypothetical protein
VSRVLAARGSVRAAADIADDIDVVTAQLEQDPSIKPETGGKSGATAGSEEDEPA